jgi:hypothetical protein
MCFFNPRIQFAIGITGLRRRLSIPHQSGEMPSIKICPAADSVLAHFMGLAMELGNSCGMDIIKIWHCPS